MKDFTVKITEYYSRGGKPKGYGIVVSGNYKDLFRRSTSDN